MPRTAERQFDAVVEQAFTAHASPDAGFVQKVDCCLLEHPGANPAQDIFAAATFQDDIVDAGLVQQLSEQQARGARADDRNLGAFRSHDSPS